MTDRITRNPAVSKASSQANPSTLYNYVTKDGKLAAVSIGVFALGIGVQLSGAPILGGILCGIAIGIEIGSSVKTGRF